MLSQDRVQVPTLLSGEVPVSFSRYEPDSSGASTRSLAPRRRARSGSSSPRIGSHKGHCSLRTTSVSNLSPLSRSSVRFFRAGGVYFPLLTPLSSLRSPRSSLGGWDRPQINLPILSGT